MMMNIPITLKYGSINVGDPVDNYEYKTQPYQHQIIALKKSAFLEAYAMLLEMGTGKSKIIIDTIGILYESGKITSAIIIAPNSVYRNWVLREIPAHLPDRILNHTRMWIHKYNHIQDLIEFLDGESYLNLILVNMEAFSTQAALVETLSTYMLLTPTLMAIDESTTIKSHTSKRSKALIKMGKLAAYRRIATGLIAPNGPEDIFPQFEFLQAGSLGCSSIVSFRYRYCKTVPINIGMRTIEKVVGTKNVEELRTKMEALSYRVTKDECLDLPDKVYEFINSDLDDESRHHYEKMKQTAIFELNAENPEDSVFIRTNNRVNMLMRLQMITCGHIRETDGREIRFSDKRIKDVIEHLSLIEGSVLIWSVFTQDVRDLTAAIQKAYGEKSCRSFYGATSLGDRDEAITGFQAKQFPYLVLNQATGRFGSTLTAASVAIYYSNSYDLEHREQSEARIHRIGQTNHCLFLDAISQDTVNLGMVMNLRNKINIAAEVQGDSYKKWLV